MGEFSHTHLTQLKRLDFGSTVRLCVWFAGSRCDNGRLIVLLQLMGIHSLILESVFLHLVY